MTLITLVGRAMSGLFDLLAVWMLYLLGKRLYNTRIGLLAAALGAAAVLPIQLSHYFAVDSFSTVFVVAGFYFAILAIPIQSADEKISWSNLIYFVLFGFIIGLAGACKVNTLPVFGIIILAGIGQDHHRLEETRFFHCAKSNYFGMGSGSFCRLSGISSFPTLRICRTRFSGADA